MPLDSGALVPDDAAMRTEDFDFHLPDELIALRPAEPRDAARLLEVRPDDLGDYGVADLPNLVRPGDALVFNDTKVIPAALSGERRRGDAVARIQANLHKRVDARHWRAFVRPARKVEVGEKVLFGDGAVLVAEVVEKGEGGDVLLAFDLAGPELDAAIATVGVMPLPPYIAGKRAPDAADAERYQTVYARNDGAVAAPTAGLHFTPELFAALEARGVSSHFLTLHVGAGTFLPVKADDVGDHVMHAEWGEITADLAGALNAVRGSGGRIIAVGTTVARLLETAVDAEGHIRPFAGETSIFIRPGHRVRGFDGLMTNFHLPRSTLFMLVAAFSGLDRMQRAYAHAVAQRYRFYSYGDASLLWPGDDND